MNGLDLQWFPRLALAVAVVGALWDVRTRRVPNVLTFGTSVVALLLHMALGGWAGMAWSLAGWVAGCAVFLPFFLLRGMGGGDVKLVAALGACLGPILVLWVAMWAAIAGGALGVVVALYHGYLRRAVANVGSLVVTWMATGVRPLPEMTLERSSGPRLAYAVPILIGTVATLWGRS